MKLLLALLIALSLAAAGCGDDNGEDGGEPSGTTPAQTATEPAPSGGDDEEAVQDVVKRWLIDGDCELMTDRFLDAQLLGLGDDRAERCELFEKQHQKPQYGEDQIEISQVKVEGDRASLVVGSDNAPDITSRYELVKTGGRWRIDSAELQ